MIVSFLIIKISEKVILLWIFWFLFIERLFFRCYNNSIEVNHMSYFEKRLMELFYAIREYERTMFYKRKNIKQTLTLLNQTKEFCIMLQENKQIISNRDWHLCMELLEYISHYETIEQNIDGYKKERVLQLLQEIQAFRPMDSIIHKKLSITDLIQEYPILKLDLCNKNLFWLGFYTTVSELYDDMRAILLNRFKGACHPFYMYQIAKEIDAHLDKECIMMTDAFTKQFLDLLSLLLKYSVKEKYDVQLNQRDDVLDDRVLFKIQYRLKQSY